MSEANIQSFRSVIDEMKAAVKDKKPAKPASKRSFESRNAYNEWIKGKRSRYAVLVHYSSVESLARLLTEENRKLLNVIAKKRPPSIFILASWVHRAPSNVTRTLSKFEKLGLVDLVPGEGKTKVPRLNVERIRFEVDVRSGKVKVDPADIVMTSESG